MEDIKSFIEGNLGKLTIQGMADKAGVHKSRIKRAMTKYGLKQNSDFVKNNRLESASKGGKALTGTVKLTDAERIDSTNRRKDYQRNMVRKRKNVYRDSRLKKKQKCVEYKGGKCQRCGYDKCIAALDFHHRDPNEKDFGLAKNVMNWERLKKELDKCDLLCANCHREAHYLREQGIECDNGEENNKTENRKGKDRESTT